MIHFYHINAKNLKLVGELSELPDVEKIFKFV